MANNLNIVVSDIATTLLTYNRIKVYKGASESGPFVEITNASTRIVLVAGQSAYLYADVDGINTDWYTTSFFHSSTLLESAQTTPRQADYSTYITVDDVRAAGISTSVADDLTVLTTIVLNQQFIERVTRQWFDARTLTLKADGNNSDTLFFPVPVIDIASLYINGQTNALTADEYSVYNGRSLPDDRKNPRVKLAHGAQDIFADPFRSSRSRIFLKGIQNQTVTGRFGYIEENGTTPALIKRALLKLVIEKILSPVFIPPGGPIPPLPTPGPTGNVLRETTDGHTIQYTFVKFGDTRAGLSGYTMDREILTILDLYKGPIGLAVASVHWIVA